jgi:DNA polymerase-3 subunit chi
MVPDRMAEVLFYHLQQQPLERVLPQLLEKTLERGWRALVLVGTPERLALLDDHLWTFRDDAFLPHGTSADSDAPLQPVLLSLEATRGNGAHVCFVVDGATVPDAEGFVRMVVMFDGNDDAAVQSARTTWTMAKAAGHTVTYWQQNERGGWDKRA